jgi:hypothetical protein
MTKVPEYREPISFWSTSADEWNSPRSRWVAVVPQRMASELFMARYVRLAGLSLRGVEGYKPTTILALRLRAAF